MQGKERYDGSNDTTPGYTRTGCMDLILEDAKETVYLLQVLGNFRGAAGNSLYRGSAKIVEQITKNVCDYFSNLQVEYRKALTGYEGKACSFSFVNDAKDVDDFFLDDDLPFVWDCQTSGTKKWEIELLILPIGPYRSISLSMILDCLDKLKGKLCYDQLIELCFVGSFQNSVLPLDKCLTKMFDEDNALYQEHIHPFYAWMNLSMEFFGSHQGDKFPRFSPGSNSFTDIFDRVPNEVTSSKLTKIMSALVEWIDVIDSYSGKSTTSEISYYEIKHKMEDVIEKVKNTSGDKSLEFGMFRLSIFTTYVTSLGLVLPGPHLHQISIPTDESASAKHLIDPFECGIIDNQHRISVVEDDFDHLMEKVSKSIGCKFYHRTFVETQLCESHPNRRLEKKDVFRKNQKLFHINHGGFPVTKEYGNYGQWIPVQPVNKIFKFIKNYK